jgi:hypothetical protein
MLPWLASAQGNRASARITAPVDETKLTTLRGDTQTPVGQANVVVTVTINGVTENVPVTLNVQ